MPRNLDEAIIRVSWLLTEWGCCFLGRPSLGAVLCANVYLLQMDEICNQFPELREPVADGMALWKIK